MLPHKIKIQFSATLVLYDINYFIIGCHCFVPMKSGRSNLSGWNGVRLLRRPYGLLAMTFEHN
ncbi:MAG: hypothetical protein ACE5KJ_00070, partial [Candidatus Zixiibacteriota bacterium]